MLLATIILLKKYNKLYRIPEEIYKIKNLVN